MLLMGYIAYIIFMVFNKQILTRCFGSHLGDSQVPLLEEPEQAAELGEMPERLESAEVAVEEAAPPADGPSFEFMNNWLFRVVACPFDVAFSYTVPTLANSNPEQLAHTLPALRLLASFTLSMLWVAALSWAMTWTATGIGCVAKLDSAVIGVTLVATGTSLSGIISSTIVAKQGYGNMAVANALGSNVFCIFVGLGLPWFISTALVHNKPFPIASVTHDVVYEAIVAIFGTLLGVIAMLWWRKFLFTASIGFVMLLWYFLFVAYVFVQNLSHTL